MTSKLSIANAFVLQRQRKAKELADFEFVKSKQRGSPLRLDEAIIPKFISLPFTIAVFGILKTVPIPKGYKLFEYISEEIRPILADTHCIVFRNEVSTIATTFRRT